MNLTPKEIVTELDKHVVGQSKAKRAVAVALRNRWRRQQVQEPLRHEITPKNILMIGPTGVGKTEIARRLARLAEAPFIKIEATKFTEVGYVGRDVDTIIRDLIDIGVKQTREAEMKKVRSKAADAAEDRVLDILIPPAPDFGLNTDRTAPASNENTRQRFRKQLREGTLNEKEIEIEVADQGPHMEIMAPPGMEEMTSGPGSASIRCSVSAAAGTVGASVLCTWDGALVDCWIAGFCLEHAPSRNRIIKRISGCQRTIRWASLLRLSCRFLYIAAFLYIEASAFAGAKNQIQKSYFLL